MKVVPPCLKDKYGNLQTFPTPIAAPTVAITNVPLFIHLGLSVAISSVAETTNGAGSTDMF